MKGATFWEYASSRKSITLSFAKVQSCNALAAITLPPLQSPTPPHPSFTPVHQGICYVLLQSDNHLCRGVLHSEWFDQKSHVISKWNLKSKWKSKERLRLSRDCRNVILYQQQSYSGLRSPGRTIISDLRVIQFLSARPPTLTLNLPSLLPPQSSRPFFH